MAENSVIGADTVVSGHIRGQGSLEILGRVEGDVTLTGNVVVGATGRVRGNLSAAQLTVAGQVQGDLRGTEVVLVERGARVAGDIASPRIGIAPGALVRGHVQTDGEPALAPSVAARRPAVQPRVVAAQPAAARVAAPQPAAARVAAQPISPTLLKAPHKAEPRKPEPARPPAPPVAIETESASTRPVKVEPRRPPPPVVPVISKGTKAKKKKGRD
ncbi:MAG TPA: polymer-forming cytoskeletal protein [Polyangiaceae bacterium]|jgi:cytoskeletal protein CcmA (bactofilin family)|nr:polymer-forming cytoskeletal protein [Polyangiaceae bacterium]